VTTRLLLIRHGATVLSAEDRFAGSTDVELSDQGRLQAEALAARLMEEKLSAIYCSPMKRTIETAKIIAGQLHPGPEHRAALKEIDHGHWEGLTRAEVEAKSSAEYNSWEKDPFTFAPEGGESGLSVLARALPEIRRIVVAHPDQNVAVVSHKATLRLVLSSLLGIDARGYRDHLDQSPCCLNVVDFKDVNRARLMLFNDISHYAEWPRRVTKNLSKWWDA
jgi:probable phosphoglycerate mutase